MKNPQSLIKWHPVIHSCKLRMVLSRSEKEQRIVEMYEAGHTIREIAGEVHMSFSPISAVIRKVSGETNIDTNNKPSMSKEIQVLKLFEKDKTPVQVAMDTQVTNNQG